MYIYIYTYKHCKYSYQKRQSQKPENVILSSISPLHYLSVVCDAYSIACCIVYLSITLYVYMYIYSIYRERERKRELI